MEEIKLNCRGLEADWPIVRTTLKLMLLFIFKT